MYETTTRSVWDKPGPDGGPSLAQLDQSITELSAHIDAATHRLLMLIAEFDRRQGWVLGGFLSCAHFLNVRIGLGIVAAREKVRVAHALESLPQISQALARGQVSYSKVRAMTRIATAENEADLLAMARTGPASQLERVVREYRKVGRAGLEQAQRQQEARHLRAYYNDAGMLVIEGRLPPEVGAVVLKALEGAEQALRASAEMRTEGRVGGRTNASVEGSPPAERETPTQRRADALGLLAERALPTLGKAERGEPYQVVLHVDADVLAQPQGEHADLKSGGRIGRNDGQCFLEHGPAVSAETARRIACDCSVVSMVHDQQGAPLSVGRKSRRVSTALYRALRARDRCCAFPGCDRTGHLEVHHVTHWVDGGSTDLDNCVLLCPVHHAKAHAGEISVTGRAPDELLFHTAAGYPITGRQAAPSLPEDPVAALVAEHEEQGLEIGPRTGEIDWWGEKLDAHAAVSALVAHDERAAALFWCEPHRGNVDGGGRSDEGDFAE